MGALLLILLTTTPQEDFAQAVEAYRNGLYGPTLYAMEQLLLEPDFNAVDSALLLAGQSAYVLGRYEKALRYLERHLDEATDPSPQALERAVVSALELNRVDKAYQLFHDNPRFDLFTDTKLRLAQTLEQEKDYEKSREVYMAIDDPDLRLVGAKMLLGAGRYDLLTGYLADLEQTYPEIAATVAALQIEATLSRGDSLASLEAGLAMGPAGDLGSVEAFTLGRLFSSFSLYEDAATYYESARESMRYDALLPLAACYAAIGDNRRAVRVFEEAHQKTSVSFRSDDLALEARVRLLSGKDYDAQVLMSAEFRSWDEYSQALEILATGEQTAAYERLLISAPYVRSEDILRRARLLRDQGRFTEAVDVYQDYIGSAPFGLERAAAMREAELLRHFEIKDAETALQRLVSATTSSEKGKILFEDAKDYERAIEFLDTVSTAQAFYYSALAYERLYLRDGKVRYLDRARERHLNLYWQFPEDRLVEDALYRLFMTEIRDPLMKMERGLDYLDHYPEGRFADEIYFLLGYVQLARGDTLAAKSGWETLYLTRPSSPYNYPVLYELARLEVAEGDTSDAVAKLSLILSVAPHDTIYFHAARRLAELEESRGRNLQALMLYRKIAEELGTIPPDVWQRSLDLIFTLRQYNEFDYFYDALADREYRTEIDLYRQAARVESGMADPDDVKLLLHTRPAVRSDEYLYWAGVGTSSAGHPRLGRHLLERLMIEGEDSALLVKAEFLVAQHQITAGEDSMAVARLRSLYERDPYDTLVLSKLVTALYRAGEIEAADSLWLKLDLMSLSDQSPLLLDKVAYLINANRVEEADSVLVFLKQVRRLPDSEDYVYYRGLVAARLGRLDEALEFYRSFTSQFPSSELLPAVQFKLGSLFFMGQEMDSAAYYYKQVLNSSDLRRDALWNLATVARNQQKWDEAFEYQEIIAQETTSPAERGEIYMEMGITSYRGLNFSQAITYFERALPLVTDERGRLLYWMARSYAAFAEPEKMEKAVSIFLQCHEEFPADEMWGMESWMQAGEGYVQLGRYEDARVVFTAIVNQRGPDDPYGMRAQTSLDKLP